jgi:hypothetical protein
VTSKATCAWDFCHKGQPSMLSHTVKH